MQVDERHIEFLTKMRNGTGTERTAGAGVLGPGRQRRCGSRRHLRRRRRDRLHGRRHRRAGRRPAPATRPGWWPAPASGSRSPTRWPTYDDGPRERRRLRLPVRALRRRPVARRRRGLRRLRLRPGRPDGPRRGLDRVDRPVLHPLLRPLDAGRPALGAGPDILDRHRNLFAAGVCGRSEDTFSAGDGGYATNIDGPVRVIRSYLGANSGTYTQREHIFYRQHRTGADVPPGARHPRDHGLLRLQPGRRRDDGTRARPPRRACTIDGVPDTAGSAAPTWEAVTGRPGHPRVDHHLADRHHRPGDPGLLPRRLDAAGHPVHRRRLRVRRQRHRHHQRHPEHRPGGVGAVNNLTATRWNVYVPATDGASIGTRVANLGTPVTTTVAAFVPGA